MLKSALIRKQWGKIVAPKPEKVQVSAKKQIIKVLVADDHPVVRKGLQSFLGRQSHLRVVGEACDGDEALRQTRQLKPDVVLMDISMPGSDGLKVTEILRKELPADQGAHPLGAQQPAIHLPRHPGRRARLRLQGSAARRGAARD